MRISVSSDMDEPVARALIAELRGRGHDVVPHGALRPGSDPQWAVCSEAAAREVSDGTSEQAVVCCWTGTGASIAANKVPGVRAALCTDAGTAAGARRWNDANVLALSLRLTSEPLLKEILDAWFAAEASEDDEDRANVLHVDGIARGGDGTIS
ncbi:RpiB/LacA/LacB family sugar-phosphate isomerase [Streptomyces sp. NPDC006622]|uniref:RpiB/LacA/LacB family sugar-phosphate isomerase n=1 Tax=Streptomyces sp. NPDC006622 TaxID=3155459 RepID=UPI0033AE925E